MDLVDKYLGEAVISKQWTHQFMIITAAHGGKGILVNYDGYLKPGGRAINKKYLAKDWEDAEKKIKAYMKKLPYNEKDYEYTEE